MTFFDYLNTIDGWIVGLVIIAIIEIIPKCIKWFAVAIRGYQEVERVYITAADTDEDDYDDFDDDDYEERIAQLKAANIALQTQIDKFKAVKKTNLTALNKK